MLSRKGTYVAVAVVSGLLGAAAAYAAQPRMVNAKHELEAAYGQLHAGLADKGGHRVKAMQLVKEAIAEVDAGIAAGL